MDRAKLLFSNSVKAFGGQAKFGKRMGVTQQLVCYWVGKGNLPADRVIEAEAAFLEVGINVSRHDLRPDVFGESPSYPKELA